MIEEYKAAFKREKERIKGLTPLCVYEDDCGHYEITDDGQILYFLIDKLKVDKEVEVSGIHINFKLNWAITQLHIYNDCTCYVDILCNKECNILSFYDVQHFRKCLDLRIFRDLYKYTKHSNIAKYCLDYIYNDILTWNRQEIDMLDDDRQHYKLFTEILTKQ